MFVHNNAITLYWADMDALRGHQISVVIVNWNLPEDTIACVRSLLEDGFSPEQILVVDNGSTDGSLDRIGGAFSPPPQLLRSERNRGFAGGNNLGIDRLLQQSTQWVWLLNNDTIVPPGTRVELERATVEHPDYALLSPLILYHDEPERVWSVGNTVRWGTLLTRDPHKDKPIMAGMPHLVEVDSLTGCALLVRSDVFARIGLLDEAYFMYAEDGDFCLRARRAGFRLACWTSARILHKVARSSGSGTPTNIRWRGESSARMFRLHQSRWQSPVHFLFSLARTLLHSVRNLLGGRGAAALAWWQGWWAGWFGTLAPAKGTTAYRRDRQGGAEIDREEQLPHGSSR
jgi:GT2 family glycosyltransferase